MSTFAAAAYSSPRNIRVLAAAYSAPRNVHVRRRGAAATRLLGIATSAAPPRLVRGKSARQTYCAYAARACRGRPTRQSCGSSLASDATSSWCARGSTGKPASFVRNSAYLRATELEETKTVFDGLLAGLDYWCAVLLK